MDVIRFLHSHEPGDPRFLRECRLTWTYNVDGPSDEVLTERQREVVLLHFVHELNQRQIACRLGMSQQSVSEHLYGRAQGDRRVGGALRKLRKACAKRGIRWE